MSHQSTHHHSLFNSIPQTHHHHQPNLTTPIKPENDSDDDDLVFLCSVPKVPHTPEEYDPECQCSTCQLVRELLAKCSCEECRGQQTNQVNQGQVVESSENVPIANAVSPTNGQPSSSSTQNNDASTSEHTNANHLDDDPENSITPDLPRLFDDESGDSSSDDSEDDDGSVDDNDSSDNKSANSDDERPDLTPVKCPKCPQTFYKIHRLLRHYRWVHQEWKPYYCRWPKCNYTSAVDHLVITHANRAHFKSENRQTAKKYVAKREGTPPKDSVLEQIVAMKFDNEKKSSCPQCGRNLSLWGMKNHIRSHANSGYRCAWPNCGSFYSQRTRARKHLCFDHLRAEKASLHQTKRYLVKVDPNFPNSNGLHDTIQNNAASTSEHTNANEQDDHHHSKSSTPDYLPRFFDDESGDSCSDDSEEDDSVDDGVDQESENLKSTVYAQQSTSNQKVTVTNVDTSGSSDNESSNSDDEPTESTPVKCPKCVKTFIGHKLLRHYRRVHLEWKPYYCRWPKCTFVAREGDIIVTHAYIKHFKSQNRQKARKCVAKRDETSPKDPVLEQIEIKFRNEISYKIGTITRSICSQCGRNLPSDHIKSHIRTHANTGYRCTWPNCGFFFSYLPSAKKHVSVDHLHVEKVNSKQTNRHLVKVNPRINKTDKVNVRHCPKKKSLSRELSPSSGESSSRENESKSSENEDRSEKAQVKCPKCEKSFTEKYPLVRHYSWVHQAWKPFYCRWPKCNFVGAMGEIVHQHVYKNHLKCQNRSKAGKYVAKRDETPPRDPVLEQIREFKFSSQKNQICQQCRRSLPSGYLDVHLRTHMKAGYRCTWSGCGFFYSHLPQAKKHVCADHLKIESVSSAQTNQYLVKVDPKTGKTTKVIFGQRKQREEENYDNVCYEEDSISNVDVDESSLNFTNESINLDDENADSATVKCPKCVKTFTEGYKLLRHYRAVHPQWKPYYCRWPKCTFVSAIDDIVIRHADVTHFDSQNRRKAKKFVGKRNETPPNDPALEQIIAIKSF